MPAVMDRLERDLVALAARELDCHALRREAMERLREGLGVDGYCFAATDPETLTMTAHATSGVTRSQSPVLYVVVTLDTASKRLQKSEHLLRCCAICKGLATATGGCSAAELAGGGGCCRCRESWGGRDGGGREGA